MQTAFSRQGAQKQAQVRFPDNYTMSFPSNQVFFSKKRRKAEALRRNSRFSATPKHFRRRVAIHKPLCVSVDRKNQRRLDEQRDRELRRDAPPMQRRRGHSLRDFQNSEIQVRREHHGRVPAPEAEETVFGESQLAELHQRV